MMVMVGGERDGKHECEGRQRKQTQHSEIDNRHLNYRGTGVEQAQNKMARQDRTVKKTKMAR